MNLQKYQETKSIAGVDFTHCDKGYCAHCYEWKKKACQWEHDALQYPEFHEKAFKKFIRELCIPKSKKGKLNV